MCVFGEIPTFETSRFTVPFHLTPIKNKLEHFLANEQDAGRVRSREGLRVSTTRAELWILKDAKAAAQPRPV